MTLASNLVEQKLWVLRAAIPFDGIFNELSGDESFWGQKKLMSYWQHTYYRYRFIWVFCKVLIPKLTIQALLLMIEVKELILVRLDITT